MARSGSAPVSPTRTAAGRAGPRTSVRSGVVAAGALVVAATLAAPVDAQAGALLQDDFERPGTVQAGGACPWGPEAPGWSVVTAPRAGPATCEASAGHRRVAVPAPFSGQRSLLLSGLDGPRGAVERTVTAAPGASLQLRLAIAAVPGAPRPPLVQVRLAGEVRLVEGARDGTWVVRTVPFTAPGDGAPVAVALAAVSDGVLVDAVSVEPAPRTASLPVLIGGLLWIGWVINRRRAHPLLPQLTPSR